MQCSTSTPDSEAKRNYVKPFKAVSFFFFSSQEAYNLIGEAKKKKKKPSLETQDLISGLPMSISWKGLMPGDLSILETFQTTQFLT